MWPTFSSSDYMFIDIILHDIPVNLIILGTKVSH